MNTNFKSRFAVSPNEAKQMNTEELRENFLIDDIFSADEVKLVLSHFDRFITAGAMPISKKIVLPNPENLKAEYFLERREIGIVNVGGKGIVTADGQAFEIDFKEALYIGDNINTDVRGGLNAGIRTYWYTPEIQENSNHDNMMNHVLFGGIVQDLCHWSNSIVAEF